MTATFPSDKKSTATFFTRKRCDKETKKCVTSDISAALYRPHESLRTTTIASTPENEMPILKTKFSRLKMLHKYRRANSRTNYLEIRLHTGFAITVVHLNVEELLYSEETKVKVKVVIVYPTGVSKQRKYNTLTDRQKHNVKLPKCFDL